MIEYSASILEEARREVADAVAEARRQVEAGRLVDAFMSLRSVGEALTGKAMGDGPLWPEARFRKAVATLLRAVQEDAPRGDHAVVSLRESLLAFKTLEERAAAKPEQLLGSRAHEVKLVISMVHSHATYLLDEYEFLMNRSQENHAS